MFFEVLDGELIPCYKCPICKDKVHYLINDICEKCYLLTLEGE